VKKKKKKEKPKSKYSNAGKGDKSRVSDKDRYDKNWERIYKPKMSDFPIPTTKVIKSKKRKNRQQEKVDLKAEWRKLKEIT
jgi:hypothetical protein